MFSFMMLQICVGCFPSRIRHSGIVQHQTFFNIHLVNIEVLYSMNTTIIANKKQEYNAPDSIE